MRHEPHMHKPERSLEECSKAPPRASHSTQIRCTVSSPSRSEGAASSRLADIPMSVHPRREAPDLVDRRQSPRCESSNHGIPRPPNAKAPHELPSTLHRHPAFRRPVGPCCLQRQGRANVGCACAHARYRSTSRTGSGRGTSHKRHARHAACNHCRRSDGRSGRARRHRAGLRG